MKIVQLESLLANCGLRNYLFVRLTTDTGLTGIGEATLEWQELTVQTLVHEWAEERILGSCPFDIERVDRRGARGRDRAGLGSCSGARLRCRSKSVRVSLPLPRSRAPKRIASAIKVAFARMADGRCSYPALTS